MYIELVQTDKVYGKAVKKLGEPIVLTDDNFEEEVLKSSHPVLIDFWAEWCGPCRMVSPIVGELAQEYSGRLKVGKIDVDSEQSTAMKYNIRSIPTLLFFKDGKVADQIIGAVPKKKLVDKVESVLGSDS